MDVDYDENSIVIEEKATQAVQEDVMDVARESGKDALEYEEQQQVDHLTDILVAMQDSDAHSQWPITRSDVAFLADCSNVRFEVKLVLVI
jgi:hypothetical protein